MTAYDNILEKGKEIGFEIGSKRASEKNSIEFAIELLKEKLPDSFILKSSKIQKEVLQPLKEVITNNYASKELQTNLASTLIKHYEYLRDEDIVDFSKLELEDIHALRVELNKEKKK